MSPTTQGGTRFTTTSGTADRGGEQTDRHGNYKRQEKAGAGRLLMFSWPSCWAGSCGHSLVGTPTTPGDQHLTGPTPLPAQIPPLLVVFSWSGIVSSISGSISQDSCDMEVLSRLGFQDFSKQRNELQDYHLILLIFWLQLLKEKSCSTHIHKGNTSTRLPSCCVLVRPASWESNLHHKLFCLIATALMGR